MKNAFEVVNAFESAVAEFAGSRFAVAIDCCSNALFLCCRYLSVNRVTLPSQTYCSVPCEVIHAGGTVDFEPREWSGEYNLDPYPIVDSAGRFRRAMYNTGEFRCVCFHWTKLLPLGKGGMILHDDPAADDWFRRARYSGRHDCDQFSDPGFVLCGWNFYLDPDIATRGLKMLKNLPPGLPDCRTQASYPPLDKNPIYQRGLIADRYSLPRPYDITARWSHRGLSFRPVQISDAAHVVRWRNALGARSAFFSDAEVTFAGHAEFVRHKPANDLVWIVNDGPTVVGMTSLTLDGSQAEYGRTIIEPSLQGRGYGERIERAVMRHGIQTLGLFQLWCEFFESNEPIGRLHRKTGWEIVGSREHPRGRVLKVEFRGWPGVK